MERVIIYLSAISWLLYYSVNIFKTIIDLDKKSIFSLFRFDSIILILIFVYIVSFNRTFVIQMLFATINLYLFINRLYERNINQKRIKKVISSNKLLLSVLYILAFTWIIVAENILELSYFYYSLFILSFFINIIIYELKKIKIFK